MNHVLREWMDDTREMLIFFSRLPVPRATGSQASDFSLALRAAPVAGAVIVGLAFTVSIALHVASAAAFWWMGRRAALSMAVACGNRNLIILLVILGGALGPEFALYVALGQFPIYLMPVAIKPIVRRLIGPAAV